MLELGGGPDLAEEAFGADHGGELGRSTLMATRRSCLQVVGEVDGRHAALAELALDPVRSARTACRRPRRSGIGPRCGGRANIARGRRGG